MISSTKDGSSTAPSFERLRSSSDSVNSTEASPRLRSGSDQLYDEELGCEFWGTMDGKGRPQAVTWDMLDKRKYNALLGPSPACLCVYSVFIHARGAD